MLFRFAEFTLDADRRVLWRGGERVHLTSKPLEVLLCLVSRQGELVDKRELLDLVWRDTSVTDDSLVQAVSEIRKALGERTGEDRFVQTVPRKGYRFVGALTPAVPASPAEGHAPSAVPRTDDAAPVMDAPLEPERRERGGAGKPPMTFGAIALGLALASAAGVWLASTAWRAANGEPGAPAVGSGAAGSTDGPRLAALTAYGTIEAGGVVLEVEGGAGPDARATLDWRAEGETQFHRGHDLVRIDERHLVGSLFWLRPASRYEVRVTGPGRGDATVATVLLETRPDRYPEPSLGTLYVAPSGGDDNHGTSRALPLKTIQRAAELARPGDLVLIAPGVYHESIVIRSSGTAVQPIVFRGDGPGVVLDGADPRLAAGHVAWTEAGDGVFRAEAGFRTGHVTSDVGRLFAYGSLADLRASRAGSPGGFYSTGTALHVKFADGRSPAAHRVSAARLDQALLLDRVRFVAIENIEIRHYGASGPGIGVFLRLCHSCVVARNRLHDLQRAGIWVEGGEDGRIEDNELWDTSIAGWPWHTAQLSSADNHGVFFSGSSPRGYTIRRNRVRGFFDGIAPCGSYAPPAGVTAETDVYENLVEDVAGDAIEAEPYCSNLRLWGNRAVGALMSYSVAPAAPGPTWIVRNVSERHGAGRGRDVWLGSALKINVMGEVTTGPVLLYHNTFTTDVRDTDGIALLNPGRVASIVARNNVIAGTRFAIYKENSSPWDGDGDWLHSADPGRLVSWEGRTFATLAQWMAAFGQERHGQAGAPLLIPPAQGGLGSGRGSPLVDRGLRLPGINDGFLGRAPDIGALEGKPEV